MITDSGFCVLRRLLETTKRGVYGSALIKKRCYFPKWIHGDSINYYFRYKIIGDVECLTGEWDETVFFFKKDPDYNIIMMSSFLGLTVTKGQKV